MNLSPHFTLEELVYSQTATRNGIRNIASPNVIGNLKVLADGLEQVRALLGKPISISSGYRCEALNTAVGGAQNPPSAHMSGFAADFNCFGYGTPLQIVKAIEKSNIKFDQLIQEGTWVHISFAPTMRQEVLTASFDSKGKATYRRGS